MDKCIEIMDLGTFHLNPDILSANTTNFISAVRSLRLRTTMRVDCVYTHSLKFLLSKAPACTP